MSYNILFLIIFGTLLCIYVLFAYIHKKETEKRYNAFESLPDKQKSGCTYEGYYFNTDKYKGYIYDPYTDIYRNYVLNNVGNMVYDCNSREWKGSKELHSYFISKVEILKFEEKMEIVNND
jgi:hypothetical protein